MTSIAYAIPDKLPLDALLAPLLAADEATTRLDERLRNSPLREGWTARTLYREAVACRLAQGELVHLEDLVLLDGGALATMMTPELSSAWHVLSVWRHASKGDAAGCAFLPRWPPIPAQGDHLFRFMVTGGGAVWISAVG